MAFRLIYVARRHPNSSLDMFSQDWREHSNRASRLGNTTSTNFRGVRQCIRIEEAGMPADYAGEFSGTNFLTMRGWEGLAASLGNPNPRDVATKEREMAVFGHLIEPLTFVAESSTIVDRRRGTIGLLHFLGRQEGIGLEAVVAGLAEFRDRVFALPAVKEHAAAFVLNRTISTPKPDADFACVSELWFDDAQHAGEVARDEGYQAATAALDAAGNAAGSISMPVRINHEKGFGAALA